MNISYAMIISSKAFNVLLYWYITRKPILTVHSLHYYIIFLNEYIELIKRLLLVAVIPSFLEVSLISTSFIIN